MLSQKTYSVDPPQKIQLLQEPRLLTLQTLCHAVHFPEKDANTEVMSDCPMQASYQGTRRRAEGGCLGALTGAAAAPHAGDRGFKGICCPLERTCHVQVLTAVISARRHRHPAWKVKLSPFSRHSRRVLMTLPAHTDNPES